MQYESLYLRNALVIRGLDRENVSDFYVRYASEY